MISEPAIPQEQLNGSLSTLLFQNYIFCTSYILAIFMLEF